MADSDFTIEGWDEFVENIGKLADKWDDKKEVLLKRMGNTVLRKTKRHIPVDTSRLADNYHLDISDIKQDVVTVGTNVHYAIYVNDGHVQHARFLPAKRLSSGGKKKYLKKGADGIMLKESYVEGKHFVEQGLADSKEPLESLVNSFMEQIKREVEGGSL